METRTQNQASPGNMRETKRKPNVSKQRKRAAKSKTSLESSCTVGQLPQLDDCENETEQQPIDSDNGQTKRQPLDDAALYNSVRAYMPEIGPPPESRNSEMQPHYGEAVTSTPIPIPGIDYPGGLPRMADPKDVMGAITAALLTEPYTQSYLTMKVSSEEVNKVSIGAAIDRFFDFANDVAKGSLAGPEGVITMQIKTLDLLFHELLRHAAGNKGSDHYAALLKLAFRAQAQSARSIETLVSLKRPTIHDHQLNLAQQQFIANGPTHSSAPMPAPQTAANAAPEQDSTSSRCHADAETVRLAQNTPSNVSNVTP
jgi:hypothetical protein